MNDRPGGLPRSTTSPSDYRPPDEGRIGDVLRRANLISAEQAAEIAQYCEAHGVRFGEAAVALNYIDAATLDRALATQFDLRVPDFDWKGEPVAFTSPSSPAAEDYRSIRNALALRWFKHPQGAQTLAVISPQRHDGRSLMAANLAVCFAQVGFRTLLIDADMRNPIQHQLFNLDDRFGLATYLSGRADGRAFYEIPGIPSLSVMPVGGVPPNPQELLLRKMLRGLVDQAARSFEMVIFDTPAAETASDYQLIGAEAVGALVVTSRENTRVRGAAQLVNKCRDFGIRVVGSAMTGQ